MEDTIPVSTGLIKRNREIAEVREGLLKADQQLTVVRARNNELLEEVSGLDSEVFEHCQRAAVSEQHLAELFNEAQDRHCEAAQQSVAHAAVVAVLRAEAAQHSEKLRPVEVKADAERRRAEGLEAEVERLNARLGAEGAALSLLTRKRQEHVGAASSVSIDVLSATQRAGEELRGIGAQRAARDSEAVAARQRCSQLEAELASERQRREFVGASLRQAMAEQATDSVQLQALESTVASEGGNVLQILEHAEAAAAGQHAAQGSSEVEELRRQLQVSEQQRDQLALSLSRSRDSDAQMAVRLQSNLDNARIELQMSLQQASEAHTSQVAQFEQEIQAERQRAMDEALAERLCTERVAQLQERRERISIDKTSMLGQMQAGDSRVLILEEELRRVRGEVNNAELQTATYQERAERAERRWCEVQSEGDLRAAKIRSMIEELWNDIAGARMMAGGSGRFPREAASDRFPMGFSPLPRR